MLLCRVTLIFIGNEVGTVGINVRVVITCGEPHDIEETDPKYLFHLWLPSLRSSENQIVGIRRKQKQNITETYNEHLPVFYKCFHCPSQQQGEVVYTSYDPEHSHLPVLVPVRSAKIQSRDYNMVAWTAGFLVGKGNRGIKVRRTCTWTAREGGSRRETNSQSAVHWTEACRLVLIFPEKKKKRGTRNS